MSDLASLQASMARGLLDGRLDDLESQVASGPITAAEALGVHRNTALHGLANALRLGHPTVDALVGEAFFDQAALAFARATPPASACLAGYGLDFADFLAAYGPARGLPYLADVARLDAAIEQAAGQAPGRAGVTLDLGEALLTLDASLQVLALDHPAAAIRDAVEADMLEGLDAAPRSNALAVWRHGPGAALRPLGPLSAAFLRAALGGGDPEAAIADGLAEGADPAVLQAEVFTAPFARLALKPPSEGSVP
jgi:hypothetical protein